MCEGREPWQCRCVGEGEVGPAGRAASWPLVRDGSETLCDREFITASNISDIPKTADSNNCNLRSCPMSGSPSERQGGFRPKLSTCISTAQI